MTHRGRVWYNMAMMSATGTLKWHRQGAGSYVAVTGRSRYLVERPDFAPSWIVRVSGRTISLHSTLADAKQAAQAREDAVRKHLRAAS